MLFLGLLMAGVAVGALTGAFEGGSGDSGTDLAVDDVFETQDGGAGDDTLTGSAAHDLIGGDDGNDDITGRGGDDLLFGGDGDDLLKGRAGEDFLLGGNGDDTLLGGQGDDYMLGTSGNDTLFGAEGNDTLIGANTISGDPDPDDLSIDGDVLVLANSTYAHPTETENNELHGEDGDDLLLLGQGDVASGGAGNDRFEIGEWITDDTNVPAIIDFNPEEDVLVVRYEEGTTEPTFTVNEEDGEHNVYANGQLVVRVESDISFTADDVEAYSVPAVT
ncbi:calcium-binding protein [Shimia sp. MIT1388]|uniref:calcium-binding protein n=1 Tax=Shimia sp. MIT1388 TaxID=3096992 RepID=UPI00399A319D